jgi:hypothetical protein
MKYQKNDIVRRGNAKATDAADTNSIVESPDNKTRTVESKWQADHAES